MKKWRSVIAFNVVMIVVAIWLFLPSALGLIDPTNPFKLTIGVILAAIMIYEMVRVNSRALLTARAEKRVAALDSGDSAVTAEDVKLALREFEKTAVVGQFAKQAQTEIDTLERKRDGIFETLDKKFQKGSLTWSKFAEVVDAASKAIVHNSAILARRIQEFDVEDYNRNARNTITGLFNRSTVPDGIRQEKREVYEMNLNDMRGIISANERLLLELDKFSLEMAQLESSENADANNHLLEEVNTIVEHAQYYK